MSFVLDATGKLEIRFTKLIRQRQNLVTMYKMTHGFYISIEPRLSIIYLNRKRVISL